MNDKIQIVDLANIAASPSPIRRRIIVVFSDTHVPITALADIEAMALKVESESDRQGAEIVAVVHLGDIGENLASIRSVLNVLGRLAPVRLMIPGNHDLYDPEHVGSPMHRYLEVLPTMVREAGWIWGMDGPLQIPDSATCILTTTAWRNPRQEFPGGGRIPTKVWREMLADSPDGKWLRDLNEAEIYADQTKRFGEALDSEIVRIAHRLIVGTHFPIDTAAVKAGATADDPEVIFNSSPAFGDLVRKKEMSGVLPREVIVVSGHIHRRESFVLDGGTALGPIPLHLVGGGYGRAACLILDVV